MKKKILSLLCILLLACILATPVFASGHPPRLVDQAGLLTAGEAAQIAGKLDSISNAYQADVVIVTTNSLDGKSPMAYADDYYDYSGYGFGASRDGILLLVCMDQREWWISTTGMCINAFTDSDLDTIGELMVDDLGNGNYADAFNTFADECEYYMNGYINGFPFDPFFTLIVALVIGLVVAVIVTVILRFQLKSVNGQRAAAVYQKPGSLQITRSNELFLYRNISRTRKANTNNGSSTHRSSSGASHGGRGGRF